MIVIKPSLSRHIARLTAVAASAFLIISTNANFVTSFGAGPAPIRAFDSPEPSAGTWKTWILSSGNQLRLPAPPQPGSTQFQTELNELKTFQSQRSTQTIATINFWATGPANYQWTKKAFDLTDNFKPNPNEGFRAMALLHIAIYDAVVAAYDSKYAYKRLHPSQVDSSITTVGAVGADPSYPSEHAVIAGAASRVLSYLFPTQASSLAQMEQEAATSRIQAGINFRSDVDQGLALGHAVADLIIANANADGAGAMGGGTPPAGSCVWTPTPPEFLAPYDPSWSQVKPWLLSSADQFRPGPPPACDSARLNQDAQELISIAANLTVAQKQIANKWADPVHSRYYWDTVALSLAVQYGLDTPRTARLLALLDATGHDTRVATWDCKFAYWAIRPVTFIERTVAAWMPFIDTPNHPSYACAHCASAIAASEVLVYFFPAEAANVRVQAQECGMSRMYGGVHFRNDLEAGESIGKSIAQLAIARGKTDGADGSPVADQPQPPSGNAPLGALRVRPIPWRPGSAGAMDSASSTCGSGVVFDNVAPSGAIHIYTLQGELLREVSAASSGCAAWDGRNAAGRDVASGIYVAVIPAQSGGKTVKKLAIER